MDHVRRIHLEEPTAQLGRGLRILRKRHDVHAKHDDWRREMHDHVEIERTTGLYYPESRFHLIVARAFGGDSLEKPFDVISCHHACDPRLRLVNPTNPADRRFTLS